MMALYNYSSLLTSPSSLWLSAPNHTVDERLAHNSQRIHQISNRIKTVYSPIVLVLGTLGNVLSFIIMRQKSMRATSTCFYLACLAVADTVALYFGNIPIFLEGLTNDKVKVRTWVNCRLIDFVLYTSSDCAIWLIISVTVDRYIGTNHVAKSLRLCTVKTARKVATLVCALMILINCHLIFTNQKIIDNEGIHDCGARQGSDYFVSFVWTWIDFCVYAFIPDVVIIILNCIIINSVLLKPKEGLGKQEQLRRHAAKMTWTLLTISFTLICSTTPITAMQIAEVYWRDANVETKAYWHLGKTLGDMLMYINHSINFFLYCVTGERFRKELRHLFHCSNQQIHPQQVNSPIRSLTGQDTPC